MINVVGLGYIGLPTALMLAACGNKVTGTDINSNKINNLRNNRITFEEEGLEELFSKAVKNGIEFSVEYIKTNTYIVAVPTPHDNISKKIDASYLKEAVESIIRVCEDSAVIIIESTIPPGTVDSLIRPLVLESKKNLELAHAPERILPGKMIYELINNSRTIGTDSEDVGLIVKGIYKSFCKGHIELTSISVAEMSKVVENTYRDVNIAFANELAKICRKYNIDVYETIRIANRHPRVNILKPGPGVGGHCISVDPWFLVGESPELTNLIHAARMVNDSMPAYVCDRLNFIMEKNCIKSYDKIGIYGLTYKADVDDIRESPSIQLFNYLGNSKADKIKKYDPMVSTSLFENQYSKFEEFVESVEVIVIMVDHKHIIENEELLKGKLVLDTKNIFKNIQTYKL